MAIIPRTLLQLAGAPSAPASFDHAALVLIDFQGEYTHGALKLDAAGSAIEEARKLLYLARTRGAPVFHVVHHGRPGGGLFNPESSMVDIAPPLTPAGDERIVVKGLPNAFAGTNLHDLIREAGHQDLIIAGFMTHMCVSSTTRAALDLGYRSTVVATACATRALPLPGGDIVSAEDLHNAELAALGDRFAVIAQSTADFA